MSDPYSDTTLFSFRSIFSPLSPTTNMPQTEEQLKALPQPAPSIQNRLAPSLEPSEKRRFHYHSISDLGAVGSTDSSPTTTISTVDDSSATENSPGSSPESPPPNTFEVGMHRPRTADDGRPFFELQKQQPVRKGRNLKNLAVNTSRNPTRGASTASLPLPVDTTDNYSTEISSAFVKPFTPSRRKPGNLGLSLVTPNKEKSPLQEIKLAIPPTPAFARPGTLRHFQSSPTLPLFSVIGPDTDGYHSNRSSTGLSTIVTATQSEPDSFEDADSRNYDVPLSQEEKPDAYPNGPICVYEPYIDLYLEPTVEQAQEYDVIMNVASEVRNPFLEENDSTAEEPEIRIDGGGGIQYAPKRDRTVPKLSESGDLQETSPTTPKATPQEAIFNLDDETPRARKEPEYIHVKWEHNSDIVPDLLHLVKLIDEKVMQGKRVLVHCQCGVSRSASLVVAYGLYKDPSVSVQQAYDEVKSRSKWIGPNMNLIMQLQEFRTSLEHGGLLPSNRGMTPVTPASGLSEWRKPFASTLGTSSSSNSISIPSAIRAQTAESLPVVISGPSSAPNDSTRPPPELSTGQRVRAVSAAKPGANFVNTSDWVAPAVPAVPVLKIIDADNEPATLTKTDSPSSDWSRRGSDVTTPTTQTTSVVTEEEFAMTPLQPSPDDDPADSFGLMSPTSTEFASNPFDRAALLARLGMGSVSQQNDSLPRRSLSLRTKKSPAPDVDAKLLDETRQTPRLRIKVSSPDLREQRQLQQLQAQIDGPQRSPSFAGSDDNIALMSPRATEFTQNPFALSLSIPAEASNPEAPASSDSDPRSPAQKGVSPITRNILDVL